MAANDVDFTRLSKLLTTAVESSTKTWCMLWECCDSNKQMLKGWLVEEENTDHPKCTCEHSSNKCNNEGEEIVLEIDGVLEKAQAVRKTFTQMEGKQMKSQATTLQKKSTGKLQTRTFGQLKSSSAQEKQRNLQYEAMSGGHDRHNAIKIGENEPSNSNKPIKFKKKLGMFQSTYQRDYGNVSLMPKSNFCGNIKNYSRITNKKLQVNSTQDSTYSSRESHILKSQTSPSNTHSSLNWVTSFNNISVCSNQHTSSTVKTNASAGCALHNPTIRKSKSVCLEEAIDILGVPPELLKVLKMYHLYLSKSEKTVKTEAAKSEFINTLQHSNQNYWNNASNAMITGVVLPCLSILREAESVGRNSVDIEGKLGFLDSAVRMLGVSVASKVHSKRYRTVSVPDEYHRREDNDWSLAGVWNKTSWSLFAGMKHIVRMRYQDFKECLKLQENMHDLQQLQLQIQILQILTNDIFPQMSKMSGNDASFPAVYRTCSALCDITKLSQPVLMQSSSEKI